MLNKMAIIQILPAALILVLTSSVKSANAAACSGGSAPGWPPANYSYTSTFLSLSGYTKICWEGEYYAYKIKSYGAQCCPQQPVSRIRAFVQYWENVAHVPCNVGGTWDSGWKYNQYSVITTSPYVHWECTGTQNGPHNYVAQTTHYFGASYTARTGHY